LNTGASMFRMNVFSLPGRGGFGLDLYLLYNSANADRHRIMSNGTTGGRPNVHGLGTGWIFDLPYILDSALYVPGRGKFPLEGNHIRDYTLHDMRLVNDTTFTSGILQSTRRLNFHNGTSYFFSNEFIIGMVDRFGNTIRFEYSLFINGWRLTRIIDTNGKEVVFQHHSSGFSRTLTVIMPDGGTFVINMSNSTLYPGLSELTSVRNQAGAVTSFNYSISPFAFRVSASVTGSISNTLLLTQVTYPSGAILRFGYEYHTTRMGWSGSRQIYRVTSRTLLNHTARHGWREYLRTTFTYHGDPGAYPQLPPPENHTYSVTVTQNNGLRTVYTFNNLHLNTVQRAYNVNTLLSVQSITYNADRLPTSISLTEHRGTFTRNTQTSFTYNRYGQVLTSVSPLAQGSTNARYRTTHTYDGRFGLPLNTTFMPNASTTVQERNVLSADGRNIIRTYVYENNVRQSRTDFTRDAHGNITEIREFPDARGTAFITTQITFDRGTLPSSIRTTNVRDINNALVGGTGIIERRFAYDNMWRTLTETDPSGYVTRWQYDRVGRVTNVTFPNGGVETYTYNDQQNRMTHRTVLGATYTHQFDGLGNLLTITAPTGIIRRNYYDNRMRLSTTYDASGIASSQRTQFSYDAFDRTVWTSRQNPQFVSMHFEMMSFQDISDPQGNSRVSITVSDLSPRGDP